MHGKTLLLILCVVLAQSSAAHAQGLSVLHWGFDEDQPLEWSYGDGPLEATTMERVRSSPYRIQGLGKYVPGVSGSALKFDGFSSFVQGSPFEAEDDFEFPKELTIEAWIALGAYPWNWAPILQVGKYKITGFYFGVDSRGRLGFHMSDATSVWHECNSRLDPGTHLGMGLHQWHHVVATYSPRGGSAIYIDGERAGTYTDFQFDYGIAYSNEAQGIRIGKNPIDLAPSDPIRDWATYPSGYTFDGIIDELKVHEGAMSAEEVTRLFESVEPENDPEFAPRRFPSVKGSGRFGAHYTRLKFYEEWDALWPVGDHMDVVVQFDESPTKVMFWRGTRYSACLVSENGKWMADQSRETGNNWFLGQGGREDMPTGCIEHMSDTQCRSSRVTIIESNDARVVVNWRYLQMDVKLRQRDIPNDTGFGEWGNEYYYIYPDAVGVRKLLPGYGGWQETILLNEPGTRPEDNVELAACTLVNMDGESRTYTWEHGYPVLDLEDAVIQMTNLKSRFRPYVIFREGGGFETFNLEARPEYSHFPWWNHWPVAQIYSDGRSASAPDRAAHSSLSWGDPAGEAALYGMTDQPAETLAALARSWNRPPMMKVEGSAYAPLGHGDDAAYDHTQRAYTLETRRPGSPLDLTFSASDRSPLVNLALVIERFGGSDVALEIDGEDVPRGRDFRYAHEYDVDGHARLVVFIKKKATRKTRIRLTPVE